MDLYRAFLAIVLSFLILLGYSIFFPHPLQQTPVEPQQSQQQAQPGRQATPRPRARRGRHPAPVTRGSGGTGDHRRHPLFTAVINEQGSGFKACQELPPGDGPRLGADAAGSRPEPRRGAGPVLPRQRRRDECADLPRRPGKADPGRRAGDRPVGHDRHPGRWCARHPDPDLSCRQLPDRCHLRGGQPHRPTAAGLAGPDPGQRTVRARQGIQHLSLLRAGRLRERRTGGDQGQGADQGAGGAPGQGRLDRLHGQLLHDRGGAGRRRGAHRDPAGGRRAGAHRDQRGHPAIAGAGHPDLRVPDVPRAEETADPPGQRRQPGQGGGFRLVRRDRQAHALDAQLLPHLRGQLRRGHHR